MNWESLAGIATRTHLRIFGDDVNLVFSDGNELKTKAIISPHMTHLRDYSSEVNSHALIASVAKEDVGEDPERLVGINIREKSYGVFEPKIEADGFFAYFLEG